MKNLVLFDQDTQHYRQSIYLFFKKEFKKLGYNLIVVYDKKLNNIERNTDFFIGIDYSFNNFLKIIRKYNCKLIIQFVWLRYKYLIPFMLWSKLSGVKIILWSHGINLQNKNQPLKNQLYYLRQRLANALIIYTPEQKKYIKANPQKVFVANNTLDFSSLPKINDSKDELKEKYAFSQKKVILTVGRMNTNNRKIKQLIKLSSLLDGNYHIIIIGPGVNDDDIRAINNNENITYLGAIYNQKLVSEYYKLSDVFVMPGAIGLAINQAFYFGTPVILERVEQGPEAYYLKEGKNGYYYNSGDVQDLKRKIKYILKEENYNNFKKEAIYTINNEASIEKMTSGFINAISYLKKVK